MEKICKMCGEKFTAHNNKIYCSKKCADEARKVAIRKAVNKSNAEISRKRKLKLLNRICPTCGKTFNATSGKQRYCCTKCRKKQIEVQRVRHCLWCDKELEKGAKKFCSAECRNKYNAVNLRPVEPEPKKKVINRKYDLNWKIKACKEHGVSYGNAAAKGLFEKWWEEENAESRDKKRCG